MISDTSRAKQELRQSPLATIIKGQKPLSIITKRIHLRCGSYSCTTKSYMTKSSKVYLGVARTNQPSKMEHSAKVVKILHLRCLINRYMYQCVCIYVYVCVCVCVYIYICLYIDIYVCI